MNASKRTLARHYPILLVLLMAPVGAQALNITVTKTDDSQDGTCDSDCSLREAIIKANATNGAHRIRLPAGTFQLSIAPPRGEEGDVFDDDFNFHGDLDVRSTLTISGAGSGQTLIDGGGLDRIFEVFPAAQLTLQHLVLRNGRHSYDGGAIRNVGDLYTSDVDFQSNAASNGWNQAQGGAVANYAALTLVRTRFLSNRSSTGDTTWSLGGAVYNEGTLLARDVEFRANSASTDDIISAGGAIFNMGIADIARAVFIGNHANDGSGAAIANQNGGQLHLRNATLSGNYGTEYWQEGILANGSQYPYRPNYPEPSRVPSMQLVHVTLAANQATVGLLNFGKLSVRNSLIMATQTSLSEPDPDGDSAVNCQNNGPDATLQARGMLLGQDAGNCVPDLAPAPEAQAFTTVMYPLADNNSSLPTHALRRGSPAVDTAVGSCPSDDQRRVTRPRDGNGDGVAVCDIGAYERPKF
ncbi:choice-of-anchor Q domain-containing protein [Pseudomonas borbori]